MNEDTLYAVLNELNSFYEDLKAEVVLIELQKTTSIGNNYSIQNEGTFQRGFRRDILKTGKLNDETLLLNLSRPGIYDVLPEGIFHDTKRKNNESFNKRRQTRKKEERDSRLLFSPIENELFNQSINIRKKEDELLNDFYNTNNDFLIDFWKLNKFSTNKYIIQLAKLLPHCHKIAGDLELIKLCLSKILEEKVEFVKGFESFEIKNEEKETVLGMNFITKTTHSNIAAPYVEFKIGPVNNQKLNLYYKNQEINEFLDLFYSYFLPLELKIKTSFFNNKEQNFVLDEKESPIMGVSTKI